MKNYLVELKIVTECSKNVTKIVNRTLNKSMSNWLNDIGNLYLEGYPASTIRPPSIKGVPAPQETQNSLSYKGAFSEPRNSNFEISTAQPTANPIAEQEEVSVYDNILKLIDKELDDLNINNSLEKAAVLVLTKLKEKISKLG